MLRWQLKKWLSTCSLKTKITCATAFGHFCILFSLFFLYRSNEQYHILITGTMINTDVPIVFLPMHKSLKQRGGPVKGSSQPAISKTAEAVPVAKKGTVATALPEANPSRRRKAPQDEKVKNKKIKETKQKAKITQTKDKPKPEPEKPVEEKPVVQETAIETPQAIQTNHSEPACPPKPIGEGWDNPDVLYVGQQEMDALQMQDYIQQEMAQHWSPPAGMRKNISCIIKVAIAFDGAISTIEVDQSSGVLIFDGAAKRAAAQLTPPQWAYGKEISLTFKP